MLDLDPYQMNTDSKKKPGPEPRIHSCLTARCGAGVFFFREHPAFQIIKFLHFSIFSGSFFDILDPDPDPADQINVDPRGSGSETLAGTVRYSYQIDIKSGT